MWHSPFPHLFIRPSEDSESFRVNGLDGRSELPLGQHPGAFGVQRKNHIHEGIDFYTQEGMMVHTVEQGYVVAIQPFTGAHCDPPSPWWHDTWAVLVEGPTGVVVYGEISPEVEMGQYLNAGYPIGRVKQVLTKDKGRPMSMLHLELHTHGTRDTFEWLDKRPASLLDPTPHLLPLFS